MSPREPKRDDATETARAQALDARERREAPEDEQSADLPKLPLFRIRPATPRSGIEFEDTADK